jgi:hypothetical protein
MPPQLKKRVIYSDGGGSAFEFAVRGKRNATLKNSVPFVDESYPDLVFLIPKQTARLWRFAGGGGGGGGGNEEPIEASVYVKKGGMGGSTWLLDLETGARLTLCRPSADDGGDIPIQKKKTHGRGYDGDGDGDDEEKKKKPRGITKHKKYAMQREIAARAAEGGVNVAVEFIKMAKGGRQADITLLAISDV